MECLSTGKYAVVDLNEGEIQEDYLEDEFFEQNLGGARANLALYEEYKDEDPIVIGTGLLTGTLVPGSALGVITGKSPITGRVCHAPVLLWAGSEIKYSGFDYVVIKGHSETPVYLWMHDDIADLAEADELWGKDTWETVDHLRSTLGDDVIQVLSIGEAGEKQVNFSQIAVNYWNSGDRFALGSILGKKKLKAIALRGMGVVEIESYNEFVDKCLELTKAVREGGISGKKGNILFPGHLGLEPINEWIEPLVHRYSACFGCPYCCNTFLKYHESPDVMKESRILEPGVMITDVAGLMGFKEAGMDAREAGLAIELCSRLGANPVVISEWAKESGKTTSEALSEAVSSWISDIRNVEDIQAWPVSDEAAKIEAEEGLYSPWTIPLPVFSDFGLGGDAGENADWWKKRNALAYNLGLCPILTALSSELEPDILSELIELGTGLNIDKDKFYDFG